VTPSAFDGSVEVTQAPGLVYSDIPAMSGYEFALGLRWRSTAAGAVDIIASIPRGAFIIDGRDGLQFNIDGEIVTLSSSDLVTRFSDADLPLGFSTSSSKRFPATLPLIERLAAARSVGVRLVLGSGHLDGRLDIEGKNAAITGFRAFLARVSSQLTASK